MHPAALSRKRAELRRDITDLAKQIGEARNISVPEGRFTVTGRNPDLKAMHQEEAIRDFLAEVLEADTASASSHGQDLAPAKQPASKPKRGPGRPRKQDKGGEE